jgi:hypothetical protein
MQIYIFANFFVPEPKDLYRPENNPVILTFWYLLPIKNKHNIRDLSKGILII